MTGTTSPGYGIVDRAYAARLATTAPDDDGPVWMVNLMQYKQVAMYGDGESDAVTGRAADDRYAPIEILSDIGAEVVFVGDVEAQFMGDVSAGTWDRIGVVKYLTRRSFIEMQSRSDFQAKHVHKEAGMARTIVLGCTPFDLPFTAERLAQRPAWSDVPHPPTADDGPIVILHVIRFADGGRDGLSRYQDHAAEVAVPHGVRIGGWFDVEGTIVGDGRQWDQVRFNLFPSTAAFMAVARNPGRMAAQAKHREPAMADTYALMVRPTINRLDGATGE